MARLMRYVRPEDPVRKLAELEANRRKTLTGARRPMEVVK